MFLNFPSYISFLFLWKSPHFLTNFIPAVITQHFFVYMRVTSKYIRLVCANFFYTDDKFLPFRADFFYISSEVTVCLAVDVELRTSVWIRGENVREFVWANEKRDWL